LDSGSINPYRQFLIFNELVDATHRKQDGFAPSFLLDQSHNVTDPIESLMNSAASVQQTYVQALLVDRTALYGFQDANDALQASNALQAAYQTDVRSILALARYKNGGAIDPIAAFRASGYRARVAEARPSSGHGGSGIV
jgi:L-rhamnose isomerase/sugar isomerase